MYIAYGWPKLLRAVESGDDKAIVHVSVGGNFLVLVSSHCIQIWTAGQHRVKLGEHVRNGDSLEEDGANVQALWNAGIETLVVLTSHNLLHFYDIITTNKQLRLAGQDDDSLRAVRVKFRNYTTIPLFGDHIDIHGLVADDENILLGLSNGRFHLVSWRGQLRGTADLWRDTSRDVIGPMFLPEANGVPSTPSMASGGGHNPFFSPVGPGPGPTGAPPLSNGRSAETGIAQLEYSEPLHLLVAVLLDGRVVLCSTPEKGLRPAEGISPEKWVGVADAVCAAVGTQQQVLAVGSRRGTVELFNLAESAAHLRTVSLFDWGYSVEDTGPVNCIRWSPDNLAFAVGWRQRGLAVWSVSGCRLMCTIRQGSMSNVSSSTPTSSTSNKHTTPPFPSSSSASGAAAQAPPAPRSTEPMVTGVATLTWGMHAYSLVAAETRSPQRLVQFPFARGCMNKAVAGSAHVWQLMQAEDRVLLIQSDEEDELKLQHLVIPQTYICHNWPVTHVAANDDGSYIAVAGQRGVILYNLRSKKWRVFGDVMQERAVKCVGLLWLGKILIICNHREATNSYELSLYPRYHLDESSLLFRQPLAHKPMAVDTWQDFILVATPPFDIRVFHVQVDGDLSPLKTPAVQLTPVRELSIMSARKPLVAMRFLPRSGEGEWETSSQKGDGPLGGPPQKADAADAVLRQPTWCMLLRTDGELSLLDLDRGSERPLVGGVEHFWLTQGRPKEEAALIEEIPWWAYGYRGMQVWYPSLEADRPLSQSADLQQLDPELDFDREVYPLGVSPAAGIIVGVSQRLSLSACADMPCFEPTPQAQPILPCLLRHLLQRNKLEEAVQLARLSANRPHFSHSLEWLLFTVFDSDMASQSLRRKQQKKEPPGPSMLERACQLIHHFPEYLDVVVSVARKTDGRHWPELFAAAGIASDLFEESFEKKQYRTATCYILVIEKLEGPTKGQQNALRLLQATLQVSMYELAGELVRFLLRSGREYGSTAKEEDRSSDSLLKSFFSFGFTSTAPKVRADVLHATVKHILGARATDLLARKELRELVAFVKGAEFDLTEFLQSQRGKSARLGDFPTALRVLRHKLGMDSLQSRLDAEFLLAHMRTVGFHEWTVVLATLLQRTEVLLELFKGDPKLWLAYSKTLQAQPNAAQYDNLLAELGRELQSSTLPAVNE